MAFSLLGARSRCGGGAPLLGTRARRSAQRRGMAARAAASTEEISLEAARAFLGKDAQVTFAPTSGGAASPGDAMLRLPHTLRPGTAAGVDKRG